MIDKIDLVSIISKYYLNGMVEAVRWEIKEGKVKIRFNAPTKEMIGEVEYTGFPLEDSTIAISNTTQLNKLIAITNGYLNLEYKKQHQLVENLFQTGHIARCSLLESFPLELQMCHKTAQACLSNFWY